MDSTTTGRLCLYTVMEWDVKSCVCGMAFLCGNTLGKVALLQAGMVVIWLQMFKSNVKPQQTNNKQTYIIVIKYTRKLYMC